MGNIKPAFIKNVAMKLIEKHPEEFISDDFQHNKSKVEELSDVNSNVLRNRIAGYITSFFNSQKKKPTE
ncbi:MAG: 30S ribosomal protein S17e [Candidatus Thermoplasmatota archaeon]